MVLELQSIEQFKMALLDFLRSQDYDGLAVIIIRNKETPEQEQITNCPTATHAACLLFDGAAALATNYRGLK